MRVWFISAKGEILIPEAEYIPDILIDAHLRKSVWCACKLKINLVNVVKVYMCISEGMHEFPGFQPCNLGNHHKQKGIGCNIEWNADKDVSAPLVQLAGELTFRNIELVKYVAWRKCHFIELCNIP